MPRPVPADALAERAARLKHTPLFAGLSGADLRHIAGLCHLAAYNADDRVVRQGDPADAFYVVVDGVLRVGRMDEAGNEDTVVDLYRGDFFGEMALLNDEPRTASVDARSDAVLMVLDRDAFFDAITHHPELHRRIATHVAQRRATYVTRTRPDEGTVRAYLSAALGGASTEWVTEVREALSWRWTDGGTVLISEGEVGDTMYLLVAGRAQAYGKRDDGAEYPIAELHPGDPFGEGALLSDAPRNASVRTLVDSEMLTLSRAGFNILVERLPDLRPRLEALARRRIEAHAAASAHAQRQLLACPTTEEIDLIVHTGDGVERNRLITLGYYRLALALRETLRASDDANWPCYGCRASLSAGYSIRGEDVLESPLIRVVLRRSDQGIDRFVDMLGRQQLRDEVASSLRAVRDCIANGNLRIFAEIGAALARFVTTFGEDAVPDERKLDAFVASLVPGRPEVGGQDVLGGAFRAWYSARFETRPARKSQLILLGNALVGVHEQTRVQPDLREAMESPLRMRLGDDVGNWLFGHPLARFAPRPLARVARSSLDYTERNVVAAVAWALRRSVTQGMMRIRMPGGDVWLGRSLEASGILEASPPELRDIEVPELASVLAELEPAARRGASDWSSYSERMGFIVRLFRATQRDRRLFEPPFDDVSRTPAAARPGVR